MKQSGIIKSILLLILYSIFASAKPINWIPIAIGDITTFVPNGQTNEIHTLKNVYRPNETVSVMVNAPLSGDEDWIGVFPKDADNRWSNVVAWNWVTKKGLVELSIKNKPMPAGAYEARLFWHNEYGATAVARQTFGFGVVGDDNEVIPYTPEALPEDILQNEAMNMDPNHPNFNKWLHPENIVNGHLELVGYGSESSYILPRDIWLPHHKYTVVWDMETTGNIGGDEFPNVRFHALGYFSQGNQNSNLNTKETLYTVIVSDDDLIDDSYKSFSFTRWDKLANSTIKISNIRIYDGVIELPKPVLKETNFHGTVSMDKEGVFRRNGKVIFPITIYKDLTLITDGLRSVDQYLAQGITGAVTEAPAEGWEATRDDRLSKMIEGGMTTMSVPITYYLKLPDYAVGTNNFDNFITTMQTLKQDPQIWNGISVLSIDNEFYHKNQQFRDAIAQIRNTIPDRPIQMLNGIEAISAWYNDYIDITGTYIANDIEVQADHLEGTTNIHLIESQRLSPNLHVPVTLLQMNQGTGENFGAILMAGVALGGTKLEYWKDKNGLFHGFRNLNMPTLPMWNQLPILRTYLNKMCELGIIETTPYIGFKVTQTNDKYEYIKARLGKDNRAYIIASNMTSVAHERIVQFSQPYKGLHYEPSGQLKDIMTGEVKGTIDVINKKVNITLAPHTWVVLEVEKK